jgi:hypothetical protein
LLLLPSQSLGQTADFDGYSVNNVASTSNRLVRAVFQQGQPPSEEISTLEPSDEPSERFLRLTPDCPAWQVAGDFLYLRPGGDAVAVAVPINGAIVPPAGVAPVQVGDITLADVEFQPGFRVGLGRWFDSCCALEANYTRFEGISRAAAETTAPIVLRSLVAHPGTLDAPTDFLAADARSYLQFQFADLDYRRVLLLGDPWVVKYLVGARFAHLEQIFDSTFSNTTLTETVDTRLLFDGGGIRLGLDGERGLGSSGFSVYGLGRVSFLGGAFRGSFVESQVPSAENPLVVAGWKDDRVISILDLELGLGWTSEGGGLRLKAGYMFSGWYNTPTTDAFIHSVQAGQAGKLNDTLTFDGLNARLELLF